ncbi:MAG: S1C family serine protease [bacterium]
MTTIEDLNKTQLILLTLLICFVVSIATGIITTSLLAEAPVSVTQTINRVVERTIETVTPAPSNGSGASVKEVTIVKEEDAIVDSIELVTGAVVRIKNPLADGSLGFYALGTIISKDGLVITEGRNVQTNASYTATLADGAVLSLNLVNNSGTNHIAVFKIQTDDKHKSFTPVVISKNEFKLGQSAISIGGKERNVVAVGRVLSIGESSVETDINSRSEVLGSPVFNLSGELMGIKVSREDLTPIGGEYSLLASLNKVLEK